MILVIFRKIVHSRETRLMRHDHIHEPLCTIYVREEQYKTEIAISKEKPWTRERQRWKNPYVYTPLDRSYRLGVFALGI